MAYTDFLNTTAIQKRITLDDSGVDGDGNPIAQPIHIEATIATIDVRINPRPNWIRTDSGMVEGGMVRIYSKVAVELGDLLEVAASKFRVARVHEAKGLRGSAIHHYELDTEVLNQ